jgi:hypothetical protein
MISLKAKIAFTLFHALIGRSSARPRSCRFGSVKRKGFPMQLPSILQGGSPSRLLHGAAAGAIATLVVGFDWGGWVTGGAAREMMQKSVTSALVLSLVCAEKFEHSADAAANLSELKKVSSWQRASLIEKGGWTTMSNSDPANSAVAQACATLLDGQK